MQNPLTFEQQQQALQQAHEPITQQPTPANYGMLLFFTKAYLHPFVSTLKSVRLRIHPDFFSVSSPQATFFFTSIKFHEWM